MIDLGIFFWKNRYPKLLVAYICIKKGSETYFFYLRKFSRLKGQCCITALQKKKLGISCLSISIISNVHCTYPNT